MSLLDRVRAAGPVSTAADVWRFRLLATTLARHHLILKYGNSLLGFVWTLLAPLGNILVLVFVFSLVVRIPLERYWAFLVSGYFVWLSIMHVLGATGNIMRDYSALRRSVVFPNEVVIVGAVGARLFEFFTELVIIVVVLAAFHHGRVPPSLLALPGLLAIHAVLAFALMLPLSTLCLLYYDVEHAVGIALGLLFYASPVFYPASMVPEAVQGLYMFNPIAGLLTLYQEVLYEGRFPSLDLTLLTTATTLALLVLGYAFFNRHRRVLPEIA